MSSDAMQLFEDQPIRSAWDAEREEWYFSVVDVVGALTGSENPRRYWSDLKRKLKSEGAVELYENIVQLKLKSPDGRKRLTDVADTEQEMGCPVISAGNAKTMKLVTDIIEGVAELPEKGEE